MLPDSPRLFLPLPYLLLLVGMLLLRHVLIFHTILSCLLVPSFRLTIFQNLDNTAPSLHFHYRNFITTTGCSAPVTRIGTFVLAGPPLGVFPFRHRATGSQVLSRSLCHVHASSVPATAWTVNRFPPDLSRASDSLPVLMTSLRFRHFIRGSLVFVSIGTHLTKSCFAFYRNAHHHGF